MHCLAAELMICAFVFQIIQAGESVLMANLLAGACEAIMPNLHIKTTGETHILVCPLLNHIRISGRLMLVWLYAGWDIGNHLIPPDKRDRSNWLRWSALEATSTSIAGAVATAASSPGKSPLLRWCLHRDC